MTEQEIHDLAIRIQEMVDSENILNPKELKEKHKTDWGRYKHYKLTNIIKFKNKFNNKKWSFLKTKEDFQKFIEDNKIKSPSQFEKEFPSVYMKSIDLKFAKQLVYEDRTECFHDYITTEELAQKFIDDNNITSPKECSERFSGLIKKIYRNNWHVVYKKQKKFKSFKWAKTVDEIINFLKERNVRTENELTTRYTILCDQCKKNGWYNQVLEYINSLSHVSSWETEMEKTLSENNIDFSREVGCVNTQQRFDFMIGSNIALEIQGPTHMWRIFGEKEFLAQRKSDLRKNRWAKENGIKIFYFSYNKYSIVERFGYPYYVYTSEKELVADILEEINNQTNNTSNGN